MSPEFYAIIGVGVSTLGFLVGLTAVMFYLLSQVNRRIDRIDVRMDRLETRMERLEDKFDQILERVHSLDIRVSKLEWMLDAALYGKPVRIPPENENGDMG